MHHSCSLACNLPCTCLQVSDFGSDVILAEACRGDHDKFCAQVPAGKGRVHACLRRHRAQLSQACRKEELQLEIEEASSIELRTPLTEVRSACACGACGSGA